MEEFYYQTKIKLVERIPSRVFPQWYCGGTEDSAGQYNKIFACDYDDCDEYGDDD